MEWHANPQQTCPNVRLMPGGGELTQISVPSVFFVGPAAR